MIQEAITQYLQKQRQVSFSPKAVLFDMDGVLYDSMRFHARAWYETATHHQLISTPELFYLYEGRTGESGILKEDGLLVLEHGKENHFEDDPHFIERRAYGSVNFSFFKATVPATGQ